MKLSKISLKMASQLELQFPKVRLPEIPAENFVLIPCTTEIINCMVFFFPTRFDSTVIHLSCLFKT